MYHIRIPSVNTIAGEKYYIWDMLAKYPDNQAVKNETAHGY
jgi:hypothetical protein